MRKKLLLILALTILVASTSTGCSDGTSNPSTLTILSITEGDVFVMKAGTDSWTKAEVGMSLEPGDSIKTGDGSGAEITFFDGSTIELQAGTEIEIADISTDTGATTITLMQTIGTTISRVTKLLDPASSYEIETPTGAAVVRGSTMKVIVEYITPQIIRTLTTNQAGNIWFIALGVELQIPVWRTCISISGQLPELMNDPPLAEDDAAITDEDTPVTVAAPGVLNNDSDPDAGDTLTVTAVDTIGTGGAVTALGADGSFTYDPNGQFEYLSAGSSTTDSFTYTVSDDYGGTDTATVTITIDGVNDAPTDISLDNSSVAENQLYGTTVGDFSTTDPDTADTFTYSLVSGDGDDNNRSFIITGSKLRTAQRYDYETKNSYSIRVRTTDSGTLYYEETFIITVTNVNDPPVAVNDSAITDEDTPVTIDVLNNDSDIEGHTLTVYSVTQGTNGSVTNNGNDVTYDPNGQFEYLPAGGSTTDSFTYTASDGHGGTDTATVTITINGVNDAPVIVNDSAITNENTPVTIDVLNNDSDIEGDTLTVDSVTQGTNGSVTNNGNDVTYDPNGQFEYLQAGGSTTDSFTYTASDSHGGTDTATVTVTINGVNDAPTDISLDNSSVAENQPPGTAVGDFSTTDPDTGDTFAYKLVSGEGDDDNTAFTIDVTQLQTVAIFDYETKNSYSIRVRTTDSGTLHYEEVFIITVTNVNDPPVAVNDSAITDESTPVTIDVLNNDFDIEGDTLTVDSVTQGTNGSVSNNGNDVTYTPNLGFSGTDSFTYTISDGNGGTDTATVTVTVTAIQTLASIVITVDQGPTAPIYVRDTTIGEMVVDGNVEASATIQVAGGHSYCVWVGGDAIRYVNSCPASWSGVGTDTACGVAEAGSHYPVHFTQH